MDTKEEHLYYIKSKHGFTWYLKDDYGRRIKTTFSKFYKDFDSNKKSNYQEAFELVPIDPKYEKKMDKKQLQIALEKEQQFDPYQIKLF